MEKALSSILPKDALLLEPKTIEFSIEGRRPELVALPKSPEEVSAILRVAHECGAPITPSGANTLQSMGAPPLAPLFVLSLSRMRNMLAHEASDLTCSAQAGMTLDSLHHQIEKHNQMLPIDPPLQERATLGGLIATNTSGPRRQGFGTFRDCLIGIQVVHADGMISKSGGMVVKNVSGYDLCKLYTGSLGTLAVITSANFKLWPRPQAQRSLLAHFKTLQKAIDLANTILGSQQRPSAVELISPGAANRIALEPQSHVLAIRCEGTAALLSRMQSDLSSWASACGAQHIALLEGEAMQSFWRRVADFCQVAELGEREALIKIAALPSDLPAVINSIDDVCISLHLQSEYIAHAGLGIAIARISAAEHMPFTFAHALSLAHAQWIKRWSNAIVLGTRPGHKQGLSLWGAEPPGLKQMRALKNQYDPKGILNRGRFVGGI